MGMMLKPFNIFLQHVLLHWFCGISLALTFIMLPPNDSDLMYSILFLECPRQAANKVVNFQILHGKRYIHSCNTQTNFQALLSYDVT